MEMKAPVPLPELDLLLLESTYGNRDHDSVDVFEQLANIACETAKNGGVLMIPSFSVGRAQLLLHMLTVLKESGRIPKMPVYLDSPMAIDVSEIYCRYAEEHRLTDQQCEAMSAMPMMTRNVDESKAIAEQRFPHIIIAGSGMATGGRILHHMKRHLKDSKSTILFTGFQAGGTRGAKMAAGVDSIKIHGQWIPVNARVEMLKGYSGHADRAGIAQWLGQSKLRKDTEICLVHGEPEALEGMREHLIRHNWSNVNVGMYHEIKRL
jgi:metallo-beta-lactamase family protein